MSREQIDKRISELRQAREDLLAQLHAVEGTLMEYENFIIPEMDKEIKNEKTETILHD